MTEHRSWNDVISDSNLTPEQREALELNRAALEHEIRRLSTEIRGGEADRLAETGQRTVADLVSELRTRLKPIAKSHLADTGKFTYTYRGVDDILDAVGNLTSELGIYISAQEVECQQLLRINDRGTEVPGDWLVRLTYEWYGPAGDHIPMATITGVMGNLVAAQNVAYRQALVQSLNIPTQQDEERHHPPESLGIQRREEPFGIPGITARHEIFKAAGEDVDIAHTVWGERPKDDALLEPELVDEMVEQATQLRLHKLADEVGHEMVEDGLA